MRTTRALAVALLTALAITGCQQKMADQPSYKPLAPCDFFGDGRSERPAVEGTVARGTSADRHRLFHGQENDEGRTAAGYGHADRGATKAWHAGGCETRKGPVRRLRRRLPFSHDESGPGTRISAFHDLLRGMSRPPGHGAGDDRPARLYGPAVVSYRALAKAPVGHLYAVIREGYGSMPSYGAQIPVRDRWAIVGYLRALQSSRHFPEAKLTDAMRREWSKQDETVKAGGAAP